MQRVTSEIERYGLASTEAVLVGPRFFRGVSTVLRLLRKQINLNGPKNPVRIGPYTRLSRIWGVLFASLIIDPFLPALLHLNLPYSVAVTVAVALAIPLLPCTAQHTVHDLIARLRGYNRKVMKSRSSYFQILLLIAILAGVLPKLVAIAGINSIFLIAVLISVLGISMINFKRLLKQHRDESALLLTSPWLQIQRWEVQLVLLLSIPLLAARAISICGVCLALPTNDYLARVPFLLAAALFLGMLKPDKRLFLGPCRKCKLPVPIVLVDLGSCLHCDQALRDSYSDYHKPH